MHPFSVKIFLHMDKNNKLYSCKETINARFEMRNICKSKSLTQLWNIARQKYTCSAVDALHNAHAAFLNRFLEFLIYSDDMRLPSLLTAEQCIFFNRVLSSDENPELGKWRKCDDIYTALFSSICFKNSDCWKICGK